MLNHYTKHNEMPEYSDELFDLRKVIEHVNLHFLSKPYPKEFMDMFSRAYKVGHGKHTIYRPNHGLAHTLRCAHMIPEVATEFSRFARNRHRYLFTQEDIKKMQVAMLFFVVGRQNEMGFFGGPELYFKFRHLSRQAFQDYCRQYMMPLFKTEEEIRRYGNILFEYHNLANSDPIAMIMKQAHCLDLVRCMKEEEFAIKCRADLVANFRHHGGSDEDKARAEEFAARKADALIHKAAKLISATGNKISHGPYKDKGHFWQFEKCSKDPDYCLKVLNYTSRDKEPETSAEVKRQRRYSI